MFTVESVVEIQFNWTQLISSKVFSSLLMKSTKLIKWSIDLHVDKQSFWQLGFLEHLKVKYCLEMESPEEFPGVSIPSNLVQGQTI